jgi:hypothetical protein
MSHINRKFIIYAFCKSGALQPTIEGGKVVESSSIAGDNGPRAESSRKLVMVVFGGTKINSYGERGKRKMIEGRERKKTRGKGRMEEK